MGFLTNIGLLTVAMELEEEVSRVVKKFVRQNKLEYDVLRYGQSMWLVWNRERTLIRQVRVAAFREGEKELLVFTPQIYIFTGDTVELALDKTGKTTSLLLDALARQSKKENAKQVESCIKEAWDKVRAIEREDLHLVF